MNIIYRLFFYLTVLLIISACSNTDDIAVKQPDIDYHHIFTLPEKNISWNSEVKPILENRCIVCHGCYDAPCQLKLSSQEGIARGASENVVYDGARIKSADPTRLFVDALTTQQWREKGFTSILNEQENTPEKNLKNSVMYKMLRLKQLHPQARTGVLPSSFDLSLGREQSCPDNQSFDNYAKNFPEQGMPFALPNLKDREYRTLVHWIAQGTPFEPPVALSDSLKKQIVQWEAFLNKSDNKTRLVSRYIYEHLFQAHIHFKGSDARTFFRLVRSYTPTGESIEPVATVRPYGQPEKEFYYRLQHYPVSIVAKDHNVYEWSENKLQRYQTLFFKPDYQVSYLPTYDKSASANPIAVFAQLPQKSRYQFLLDDARFYIQGFIKGPVCRGQIALSVIEDQFWVFFTHPDAGLVTDNASFLEANTELLSMPTELGNTLKILRDTKKYRQLHEEYMRKKDEYAKKFKSIPLDQATNLLWDGGEEKNPSAALTVFRHFDSASVRFGLSGDYPETAWIIDYPILERIHYLLVAGFDVYGNLGHQLTSRLYMDFLRTEAEDYFLAMLPAEQRKSIRENWYQGIRQSKNTEESGVDWLNKDFVTGYETVDVQRELYQRLEQKFSTVTAVQDFLNRCVNCAQDTSRQALIEGTLSQLHKISGKMIQYLPDLAMLRVVSDNPDEKDFLYTIISNKAYKSVSSMFASAGLGDARDFQHDTQTIVAGVEGSYPNFFYWVKESQLVDFVNSYNHISSAKDYEIFVAKYGVRRTDSRFWDMSDWVNLQYAQQEPIASGILDLNRFENR